MAIWNRAPLPPPPRRQRTDRRALLASAESLQGSAAILSGDGASGSTPKRQDWQKRFWEAFHEVGEVHYTATFFGWCFSRVTLQVGVVDRDGNAVPLFDDEGKAVEEIDQGLAEEARDLVGALRSNVGGQAQLMFSMGVNLAGPGEVALLRIDDDESGERFYEALSTEEIYRRTPSGNYVRRPSPSSTDEQELPEDAWVLRIWQHDPQYSDLADSGFRPVLDIVEELVLLTRAVRAIVTSRLAGAGVYWIPDEISYPDDDTAGEGTEEQDPFTRDLIAAMTTPIRDRASAASVVPMVVRAPAEFIEKIRHDDFARSFDTYPSVALRREAVERFAQGIDLPVEVTTGHKQTTFANAAAIDESLHKAHIEPKLAITTDGLAVGYLRPSLLANTDASQTARREQVARLVVLADASELVAEPDMGESANNAHDRWTISDATLRRSHGFSEGDKPDEEEIARRIAIRQASRAATAPDDAPSEATPEEPPPPEEPAPEEPPPGDPDAPPEGGASLVDRIHAATEFAIERAVTRAGNRLRAKVNGKAGVKERLASVPAQAVAATLGQKAVTALLSEAELFEAEFEVLGRKIDEWAQGELHTDPGGVTLRVLTLAEEAAHRRLYSATAGIDRRDIQAAVW